MLLRQKHWWALLVITGLALTLGLTFGGGAPWAAAQDSPCGDTVTVTAGDTLWNIARRCNTTIEAIMQANPSITDRRLVYVGQVLQMPGAAPQTPGSERELNPRLAYMPVNAAGGSSIHVIATGFPANQPVNIGFGPPASEYGTVQTATTSASGALNLEVRVPAGYAAGEEWVLVVETTDFQHQALSTATDPVVTISPLAGPAGTAVEVIANNFPPEEAAIVGVGPENSEYSVSQRVRTGPEGALSARVTIPSNAAPGERWVMLVESSDHALKAVSSPFFVTSPQQDGDDGSGGGGEFTRADIYLIALEDAGQSGVEIGCGDSAVPVEVTFDPTRAPLTAALERLLAIDSEFYGQSGLYNALHQSDLTLDGIDINGTTAEIALSGSLSLGGTCDAPRVEAQLRQTALQYRTIDQVTITLNGQPLSAATG